MLFLKTRRLRINIHLLGCTLDVIFLNGNKLAQLFPRNDLLVQNSSRTLLEPVIPLLLLPLHGLEVVPQQFRLLRSDDTHIHITSRSKIVIDTSQDSIAAKLDCLIPRDVLLPLCLEYRHSRQATGTHGHVGQFIGRAVGVNGEQVSSCGIYARNDKVGTDMTLIAEEVLLQHCHACDDAGFAAGRESVQLDIRRDDGCRELCVGGCTGSRTPDLRGDVVEFLAVLSTTRGHAVSDTAFARIKEWLRRRNLYEEHVRTLSATMGPLVARVSAAMTTPPLNKQPTIVVPVDVAFGRGTP